MKKIQTLFAMFVVLMSSACAIPMAHVQARQSLPLALPKGCYYADQGVTGDSSNYAYVNGFVADPGLTFMQFAQGNAFVTVACTEAATMAGYTELYRSTMLANAQMLQGGGGEIKKELDKTKDALGKLSDNVADLATLAASQPAEVPATGKPGKGGKQQLASAPAATPAAAPVQAPVPAVAPPAPTPTPIDPSIIGRIEATKTNAQLVGVLQAAAQANPAHATMFNNLAAAIGASTESSFEANKKTLADSFR